MDDKKICFISCVNDLSCYRECLLYLQHLLLPSDMQAEYLSVEHADSMAAGYNQAMRQSDAKYKIYLHQDVFLLHKDILTQCIHFFINHPACGMIGLAGCEKLPASGIWWKARKQYGTIAHAYEPEEIRIKVFGETSSIHAVEAIDGLFMATQYDICWREDILQGWHFYDISQSMEFWRHGMRVVVPAQAEPWCVHACGEKDLGDDYWHYRDVFQAEYVDLHKGQQPLGGSNESGCLWNNLQK